MASEVLRQLTERTPPMRQGVLLARRHLGERAPVALGRDEDRVVAEAARRPGARRATRPSTTPRTTTSQPSGHTAAAAAT